MNLMKLKLLLLVLLLAYYYSNEMALLIIPRFRRKFCKRLAPSGAENKNRSFPLLATDGAVVD
jgi:hypothetical protein